MKFVLVVLSIFTINSFAQGKPCSKHTLSELTSLLQTATAGVIEVSISACDQEVEQLNQDLARENNTLARSRILDSRTAAYYNLGYIKGWKYGIANICNKR